jgi:hypothetical protein
MRIVGADNGERNEGGGGGRPMLAMGQALSLRFPPASLATEVAEADVLLVAVVVLQ